MSRLADALRAAFEENDKLSSEIVSQVFASEAKLMASENFTDSTLRGKAATQVAAELIQRVAAKLDVEPVYLMSVFKPEVLLDASSELTALREQVEAEAKQFYKFSAIPPVEKGGPRNRHEKRLFKARDRAARRKS